MNFEDALKAGGASATIIALVGIGVKVIQSFCGHRLRSECCGHTGTIGVGVENMTPRKDTPKETIEEPTASVAIAVRTPRPSLNIETASESK